MMRMEIYCLLIIGFMSIASCVCGQADGAAKLKIQYVDSSTPYYDAAKDRFYKDGYEYVPLRKKSDFKYKSKGYFFESQLMVEWLKVGFRILNGYKFHQFATLAIGCGVEFAAKYNAQPEGASGYAPFYLYYTGDILKKRITPFYSAELGYAMIIGSDLHDYSISRAYDGHYHSEGGLMGGIGFGVRGYSRKTIFHWSLSANVDFTHFHSNEYGTESSGNGGYGMPGSYTYFNRSVSVLLSDFGIRFSMGLIKYSK